MSEMNCEIPNNVSDDSNKSSYLSGGSCSPPSKRLRSDDLQALKSTLSADFENGNKASSLISITSADYEDDKKTSRSSISKELGGPHQSQPRDPYQAACEFFASKPSSEERIAYLLSLSDSDSDIEVDESNQPLKYAELALTYYKETKGDDYEYVEPRSMCPVLLPTRFHGVHLNFFARLKGVDSAPPLLFFAELEHRCVTRVLNCSRVALEVKYGAAGNVVEFIFHPPDIECSECKKYGDGTYCCNSDGD